MEQRHQQLHVALRNWCPPTPAEAEYRTRMLALCGTASPLSRQQYAPGHFTASAFVLSPDSRALLLIYHRKLKRWLQPGGHVEPHDNNLLCAAQREAQEECCLEASDLTVVSNQPFDIDIHTIPAHKNEPAHEHFDVRYLFRCHHLEATAGDGVLDLRYVPLEDVKNMQSDASVMRAVHRLQGQLKSR